MSDNFINMDAKLNHNELDKLEDENAGIGEVGDILGDLGEDDDDEFLKSFTADMGVDFNILEYADPELDLNEGDQSNLLDSLDFDETDEKKKNRNEDADTEAKPNKLVRSNENKAAANNQLKANINQNTDQAITNNPVIPSTLSNATSINQMKANASTMNRLQALQMQQQTMIQQQNVNQSQPQPMQQQIIIASTSNQHGPSQIMVVENNNLKVAAHPMYNQR